MQVPLDYPHSSPLLLPVLCMLLYLGIFPISSPGLVHTLSVTGELPASDPNPDPDPDPDHSTISHIKPGLHHDHAANSALALPDLKLPVHPSPDPSANQGDVPTLVSVPKSEPDPHCPLDQGPGPGSEPQARTSLNPDPAQSSKEVKTRLAQGRARTLQAIASPWQRLQHILSITALLICPHPSFLLITLHHVCFFPPDI